MSKTVPELLRDAAEIFEERSALYGANYKRFGIIIRRFFPDGLKVDNADDWGRLALFVLCLMKLSRYAEMFSRGGHDDSLADLAVYSQMLMEVDREARGEES